MAPQHSNIVIIGAGLTGLTLGYHLRNSGLTVRLLEGRDRLGGRILTSATTPPIEMGATWLASRHVNLVNLLEELGLEMFEQRMGEHAIYEPISTSPPQLVTLPHNPEPSFRIKGGTSQLIQALAGHLDPGHILLNQAVQSIATEPEGILVTTSSGKFLADKVISTLPPYLLTQMVDLPGELPSELLTIAQATHTWMGDSIKFGLSFEAPFWRAPGSSGTLFSNTGPIPEMYDHANVEDDRYALKGFLQGIYHGLSREERLGLIQRQLSKYYGDQAQAYSTYTEMIWRDEPFTFIPYSASMLPHSNNGNPVYHQPFLQGRFWVAGAETAQQFPGYMDGAVESAQWLASEILSV